MTREPLPNRDNVVRFYNGEPGRYPFPAQAGHERPRNIEDAARMVGAEEDTGPGYIAPPPLSRFDWLGWGLIFLLAAASGVTIWIGVS